MGWNLGFAKSVVSLIINGYPAIVPGGPISGYRVLPVPPGPHSRGPDGPVSL